MSRILFVIIAWVLAISMAPVHAEASESRMDQLEQRIFALESAVFEKGEKEGQIDAPSTGGMIKFEEANIYYCDGDSMKPTIESGDALVIVEKERIERNDVVICFFPNRTDNAFIKRCVAVPGDIVYRENGVTHVMYADTKENVALDGRYAIYFPEGSPDDYGYYFLQEDEYFVVGDNRYNSHDSRDWRDSSHNGDVGPISRDLIVGVIAGKVDSISVSELEDFKSED